MKLEQLVRPNIWNLTPYSSARSEFKGEASVFLDANENPYNSHLNRYPDPLQQAVKSKIAELKGVSADRIFLGVGSDEPIDLTYRIFCRPSVDNVVAIDPSYGMYQVAADINDVEYRKVPLDEHFDFTAQRLLEATDANTKLIFLCSPNNPTGNSLNREEIVATVNGFEGIVILDEAYIDFSEHTTFLKSLHDYPNMIIFQTFSKAWASAGVRLGMAFAAPEVIQLMNRVKYPYNINQLTQEYALAMLERHESVQQWVSILLAERKRLQQELRSAQCIRHLYPTDANFILAQVSDANAIYQYLVGQGVIVRNRNTVSLCRGCLRITVGTPEENDRLICALKEYR